MEPKSSLRVPAPNVLVGGPKLAAGVAGGPKWIKAVRFAGRADALVQSRQ
tara:strand:+ start:299 stop:448 length:150 start_codon:yes stop_codon:yes gene_type:complete